MYSQLIQFFGKVGTKYFGKYFQTLRDMTEMSNLPIVYETYIGQLFFCCFISLNAFFVYFLYLFLFFWGLNFGLALAASAILTLTVTSIIATVFYLYPFFKYQRQKEDIERVLPFGVSYMGIISKSGVPLQKTISYISREKEFGEFSKEFERVHNYTTFMGKDIVSSLKETAKRTPSDKFRVFLEGLTATMMSGSDINKYLAEESKAHVEGYRERAKKYTSAMSIFADVYIIMLLLAPLCLMIILSVLSLIDATFLGVEIFSIAKLIVYLFVPVLGLMYLAVLGTVRP
ncbi:MAG: type II secretion system F family protein [Candidatus Aenigmatarchaeota archaeon]